jgi:uncharacterized protein YbcI
MVDDTMDGKPPVLDHDSVLMQVSNEMVRLYKTQFGRGPTKARTNWAGPDTLISTLENSLTPAERNMVAMGEHHRLRDTRMFIQYATEEQFCGIVERLTGRKVRAFVSGIDTMKDVSSEVFYLHPRGHDGDNGHLPRRTSRPRLDGNGDGSI